jgi:hypothetical protein
MITYWIRLHEDKTNCILKAALDENNKMHNNGQHCWVSCIYYILKELDMLKMFNSPLTCGAREINIIRKKLKERYTKICREKINLVKQNPATIVLTEMKINYVHIVNLNLYSNRKNT